MADLTPCLSCGNGLGPGAARCPQCGSPTPTEKLRLAKAKGWRSLAVLVLVLASLLGAGLYIHHRNQVEARNFVHCVEVNPPGAKC